MNSPEEALDEFINEVSTQTLLITINNCKEFLNSNLTKKEKEDFIENETYIYFPAIGLTPLEWLIKVVKEMQESIQ